MRLELDLLGYLYVYNLPVNIIHDALLGFVSFISISIEFVYAVVYIFNVICVVYQYIFAITKFI